MDTRFKKEMRFKRFIRRLKVGFLLNDFQVNITNKKTNKQILQKPFADLRNLFFLGQNPNAQKLCVPEINSDVKGVMNFIMRMY